MKSLNSLSVAVGVLLAACSADAAIVLDFGATGQSVQTSYNEVSGSTSTLSDPYTVPSSGLPDGETVSFSSSAALTFRNRGNFTDPSFGGLGDLMEDYLRAGTGNATGGIFPTMTITIGGLAANTAYNVNLHLYDGAINSTRAGAYSFTINGTGDTDLGNNTYNVNFDSNLTTPSVTAAELAGYSDVYTSTAGGSIVITITQTGGAESSIPLNSLTVTVVPEPRTGILGGLSCLVLLGVLRRVRAPRIGP